MQISSPPLKWTVPFAQGDGSRVEIPATTADPTRFSLTLGSPPLTGQPPETGGVPPQLEDFNGAFNQIARFVWWNMGGGPIPYDATWATDTNVNGYAQGAVIRSADLSGCWLSLADNNTVNPDTVGTNWAPLSTYGVTALTGQTGGTTTLTPAQAMKRVLTIAGTLTSNLTVVVPAWTYDWSVTNSTTGAFTVTVKTPAGAGTLIPQNSTPFSVRGDGTNVGSLAPTGRLLNVQAFLTAGTYTYTPAAGTTRVKVRVLGGGGAGGGTGATGSGQIALAGPGNGGAYAESFYTSGFSGVTITVGAGGTGVVGTVGGNGGASSFGALVSAAGGLGGNGASISSFASTGIPRNPTFSTGGNIINSPSPVANGATSGIISGNAFGTVSVGANTPYGSSNIGGNAQGNGAGGTGFWSPGSTAASAGFNGAPGFVIVEEYS